MLHPVLRTPDAVADTLRREMKTAGVTAALAMGDALAVVPGKRTLENCREVVQEVVSARERSRAGRIADQPEGPADDTAANQAMASAESAGWLKREQEETFPFYYYWDSPSAMKEFIDEEWSDFAAVEESVWQRTRALWAVADADARVRVQLTMLITRWKKTD